MGAATVDGPDGQFIQSTGAMFARFSAEPLSQLDEWEQRLFEDPAGLEAVELDVQNVFLRGAGLMIAGLVSVTLQKSEMLDAAEQTRQQFTKPLEPGRERRVSINLLGGVMMWVTSLYCQARRDPAGSSEPQRGFGVYTELVPFGFGKGLGARLRPTQGRGCRCRERCNNEGLRVRLNVLPDRNAACRDWVCCVHSRFQRESTVWQAIMRKAHHRVDLGGIGLLDDSLIEQKSSSNPAKAGLIKRKPKAIKVCGPLCTQGTLKNESRTISQNGIRVRASAGSGSFRTEGS